MELYKFFWGALAWMAAVAWFPINVPLLALAYKIQNGPRPLSIDSDELWHRSIRAGFFLFLMTAGFILLDYFLADWCDFPAGPVHLVIFMAYVPAASWLLFMWFAYTDYLDGLGVFVVYFGLLIFILFVLNAILYGIFNIALWNHILDFHFSWLKTPS